MDKSKKKAIKKIEMTWIVVSDFQKAKKFFTESVGLKLNVCDDDMGWAELSGHENGGSSLGIAGHNQHNPISPGQNAVTTFTVDNIETAAAELSTKGVKLVGKVLEIPGEVKLQLFTDLDGNKFQLVENLRK